MMKKRMLTATVLAALLLASAPAWAHAPHCDCSDNGDGSITCVGGFSNGASAAGVKMSVVDEAGKAIAGGKMNQDGEFTFKKPVGAYTVRFEAGAGHALEIMSTKIAR